jgi:hypothetical protein
LVEQFLPLPLRSDEVRDPDEFFRTLHRILQRQRAADLFSCRTSRQLAIEGAKRCLEFGGEIFGFDGTEMKEVRDGETLLQRMVIARDEGIDCCSKLVISPS